MNNIQFVNKLKNIAENYDTLYVMGCFGSPMTAANRRRFCDNHSYNRQPERTAMIQAAKPTTFGFDCVCLIKGVLWGWAGDKTKVYGGATYVSNGVPDYGADMMIQVCSNVSADFSKIEVGEAVWMSGHIGIYIGNGLAVECSPKWKNGVQITACNRSVKGYNRRNWTKHGKLPYIEYAVVEDISNVKPEVDESDNGLTSFIKDVQRVCGAAVDGIAGPETLSKTITLSSRYNKQHPLIEIVQKRLKDLGYVEVGTVDGVAGPKFTSAVAHFQQDNDCVVDGVITQRNKTWKKLLGMA